MSAQSDTHPWYYGTIRRRSSHGGPAPAGHNRRVSRIPHFVPAILAFAVVIGGCASPSDAVTLELRELNGSGVTGTVTLTEAGEETTLVEVDVDPAGYPSMPAHIHPGSCDELVPQPKYPLASVIDGVSSTEVAAPLEELFSGGQALNVHASNDQLDLYTACVDLS